MIRPFAYRLLPLLLCATLLAGCAEFAAEGRFTSRAAPVTAAQACAIGYDLARQIHDRVSLRRTVLLAPRHASPCERHALDYLRRAGFRIDETGRGGTRFDIALDRAGDGLVMAVTEIGEDLRIARIYRPVRTGVIAAGPVSVQHLDPDTYDRRGTIGRAGS